VIDSCSATESAGDIVLLRLHKRVPIVLVLSKHPPGINGVAKCSQTDTFTGRIVGYGPIDLFLWQILTKPVGAAVRNTQTSADWLRKSVDFLGAEFEYTNFWAQPNIAFVNTSPWYNGSLPGDSG